MVLQHVVVRGERPEEQPPLHVVGMVRRPETIDVANYLVGEITRRPRSCPPPPPPPPPRPLTSPSTSWVWLFDFCVRHFLPPFPFMSLPLGAPVCCCRHLCRR